MGLAVLLFGFSTSIYLLANRRGFLTNPVVLFLCFQTVMFLGSLKYLDESIEADIVHLCVMVIAQFGIMFGSIVVDLSFGRKKSIVANFNKSELLIDQNTNSVDYLVHLICIVSIIVCVTYYIAIGYNFMIVALRSLIFESSVLSNARELRLLTYSGDRYLAPGYVNQFKNILFPLMCMYLYVKLLYIKNNKYRPYVILYTVLSLLFLAGTGQRGATIYAIITAVILINLTLNDKDRIRHNLVFFVSSFLLFSLLSIFLGREVKDLNQLDFNNLLSLFTGRIFDANQLSSVIGFRYVYNLDTVWGKEWLTDLISLLPGQRTDLSIANIVHGVLYGTTRGTAPISIWGDVWLNFGLIGIIIIPVLIGVVLESLYYRMITHEKSLERLLCYALVISVTSRWIASSPTFLVREGIIAVLVLRFLFKIAKRTRIGVSRNNLQNAVVKTNNSFVEGDVK